MRSIKTYFKLTKGLLLTWGHFLAARKVRSSKTIADNNYFTQAEGIVTIQYPREKIPVPEVGRYQLDVAIEDCIVCDLCAKICPVDCIEIEAIQATKEIGKTSDGTPKRLYAAKFDIDMGKCMYCGLCTTVCPTECIIMTDTYDRSVQTMDEMNYTFAVMTEDEIKEKRTVFEKWQAEKAAAKAAAMKRSQ